MSTPATKACTRARVRETPLADVRRRAELRPRLPRVLREAHPADARWGEALPAAAKALGLSLTDLAPRLGLDPKQLHNTTQSAPAQYPQLAWAYELVRECAARGRCDVAAAFVERILPAGAVSCIPAPAASGRTPAEAVARIHKEVSDCFVAAEAAEADGEWTRAEYAAFLAEVTEALDVLQAFKATCEAKVVTP